MSDAVRDAALLRAAWRLLDNHWSEIEASTIHGTTLTLGVDLGILYDSAEGFEEN